MIRRKKYEKSRATNVDSLMAELEALKAEAAKKQEQSEQKAEDQTTENQD